MRANAYREQALECRRLATTTRDPEILRLLLNLAERFDRRADQVTAKPRAKRRRAAAAAAG
ncbi:MAG TPA: hypothetical protein VMB81_26825 [Candidatus Sulfotelmatobacter sp.]|nr:hypothetical protein [Candidatus Sulfotelmatobacter sp.]